MRKFVVTAAIAAIVMTTANAYSWDGSRKGFILGGGLGGGAVLWDQEVEVFGYTYDTDTESDFALITDFKIGYAPTDQLALYYFDKTGWFTMVNVLDDDVIIAAGLSGFGVSYYFAPEAPSIILSGGLGVSTWNAPFEDGNDPWYGFGLTGGVGYEITKYISANFDVVWGTSQDNESNIDITTNAYGFMLTINALGY